MRTNACRFSVLALLGLLGAFLVGWSAGHQWAAPVDLWRAAMGATDSWSQLLIEWRLPRVLAAGLIGALLGLGGAIFQGVFRNPLAEPYLLGSAGGAAVGATVALLAPLALPMEVTLPVLAFVGAWGATWLVLGIARSAGVTDAAGLLLAGVALAAALSAARSFLMLSLSDETVSLQIVLSWLLGGVQTPDWSGLAMLAGLSGLCLALALTLAKGLDQLGLGEAMATSFGLNVERFIAWAVLVGALIVAVAVAHGGLVAFVGLVAPHMARWSLGPRQAALLPASAIIGAALVMLADGAARAVLPPGEVPLGLVTALIGAPFFLVVLARMVRR
jgi:iron complex transport system permease protein